MARVLLLGGLDPSGGAGITVDATVVSLLGGDPLPIALATTVQGLRGFVRSVAIDAAVIREQIRTVLADGPVGAVKIGYVGSVEQVIACAEALQPLRDVAKIVIDPVLSATAGGMNSGDELAVAYREHLVPFAHLITPNTPELAALADGRVGSLLELGAQAVLHKGGHGDGPEAIDELWPGELWPGELVAGEPPIRFQRPRFDCGPVRGTGCALAAAIATHLADKRSLLDSCRTAGDWLGALLSRVKSRPDGLPSHLPFNQL
ncbi:MAG: hydroxymethylpyrimidine/phosphomethylpyrimidine kinase [Planctomycetota bacterium]|jgi:hydroxymethylpyrimidine/phosphomethylpyrimidine kinase